MKRCRPEVAHEACVESNETLAFLIRLQIAIVTDVSLKLGLNLARDVETINQRVLTEGFSFLSKTLPLFCAAIISGLEQGYLELPPFFPFKKKRKQQLPAFLQAITSLIFDSSGLVRDDADPDAVGAIEQICTLYKKYETPLLDTVRDKAYEDTIRLDDSLPLALGEIGIAAGSEEDTIIYVASQLLSELFGEFDPTSIMPRHGPGSTACGRIEPWLKYRFRRPNQDCVDLFGGITAFTAGPGVEGCAISLYDRDFARFQLDHLPQQAPNTSRMAAVPKDSRGPRVINLEQHEYMFLQQGVWQYMKAVLEAHPYTKGHVNFTDQSVNAKLALRASVSREWGTLDLKDASNRNSLALVYNLMPEPLLSALLATRATHVEVPDLGIKHKLKMFAPMGSAVCFPVESVVFWSLLVARLIVSGKSLRYATSNVYVYGDDIIVPRAFFYEACDTLETYGLKVNKSKSFVEGYYRESCGLNAYKGVETTPFKIKKRLPVGQWSKQKKDSDVSSAVVAWISYSNQFHKSGFWKTADLIKQYVEHFLCQHIPVLPENSGALGWFSFTGDIDRFDAWKTETPRVKDKYIGSGFKVIEYEPYFQGIFRYCLAPCTPTIKPSRRDFPDEAALLRYFTEQGTDYVPEKRRKPPVQREAFASRIFSIRNTMEWKYVKVIKT